MNLQTLTNLNLLKNKYMGKTETTELDPFEAKTAEIAEYYGFNTITEAIEQYEASHKDTKNEREDVPFFPNYESVFSEDDEEDSRLFKELPSGKKTTEKPVLKDKNTAPIIMEYLQQEGLNKAPQPVRLWHTVVEHEKGARKEKDKHYFNLDVIGATNAMTDALCINVPILTLREAGVENVIVEINTLGDPESRKEYIKQLAAYYKKFATQICTDCKTHLKTAPLHLLLCDKPQCIAVKEKAPQSIAHLSPEGKEHFKQVLEFLDALDITYYINPNLIRSAAHFTHTVFRITGMPSEDGTPSPIYALGGRYDTLAKRCASKKDVPAVGVSLFVNTIREAEGFKPTALHGQKKSKAFFIHIGQEAKLRSMNALEVLRRARVPISHALTKDSLSQQLGIAERSGITHALIYGQKEALDGTCIVRNLETRSQTIISIKDLPDYIKREL
jgi:histidyl-tRNA synthetase